MSDWYETLEDVYAEDAANGADGGYDDEEDRFDDIIESAD